MAAAVPSIEKAAAGAAAEARNFLRGAPKGLLINGRWLAAKSGATFETINPANEEVLALVAEGGKADIDDAVTAARSAFESGKWPSMRPHQRARYLFAIADLVEAHGEELAHLITLDNGKPITESVAEVRRTADTFRYYAGWATKFYGETNPSEPGIFNYTLREPAGVCGQIIPWNGPLSTISWKVAPALAFGNTLVLKPAEQTPLPALRMGELICAAGVPDGVVNIVTG
ncbi:MAG: aldehyde dehydrogenase family protein, partial [Candidatus Binataceae bacterium]